MFVLAIGLNSCSEEGILDSDQRNNDLLKSNQGYSSEEINLAIQIITYYENTVFGEINSSTADVMENEISNNSNIENVSQFSEAIEIHAGFDSETTKDFLLFLHDNEGLIQNYSKAELQELILYTYNNHYSQPKGMISTVAGWFGVGGEDASCGTRVALAAAEIAFVGAYTVASGGSLGALGVLELVTGYADLVRIVVECS